jgi:hypothetical protein
MPLMWLQNTKTSRQMRAQVALLTVLGLSVVLIAGSSHLTRWSQSMYYTVIPSSQSDQDIRVDVRKHLGFLPLLGGKASPAAQETFLALLNKKNIEDMDHNVLFSLRLHSFRAALHENDRVRKTWTARLAAGGTRGIITCAGTRQQMANAFVTFSMLRSYNCTLPLGIMHWGQKELDSTSRKAFQKYLPDVKFYDISKLYPKQHASILDDVLAPNGLFGFAIKAAALYTAPYREVLLVDADSLPLQDPSDLFSEPGFLNHGNMWWPDISEEEPGVWKLLNMSESALNPWFEHEFGGNGPPLLASTPTRTRQVESGQILINRDIHWEALEWILFLNSHGGVVYQQPNMWGDKDTFRAAFALTQDKSHDFFQVPHAVGWGIIDYGSESKNNPRYKFGGAVQFHPSTGSPLFHHRTAWSKLPGDAYPDATYIPTHITPPLSFAQNSIFTSSYKGWNPNFPVNSLFDPNWRSGWGYYEREVRSIVCEDSLGKEPSVSAKISTCNLSVLTEADVQCCRRTMAAKERSPWPITLVQIESDAWLGRRFREAIEAHKVFLTSTGINPPER